MSVPDWSGEDYGRVSALQRSVATETLADLVLGGTEWVLDIGCGDGFLTRQIAARVPGLRPEWVAGALEPDFRCGN